MSSRKQGGVKGQRIENDALPVVAPALHRDPGNNTRGFEWNISHGVHCMKRTWTKFGFIEVENGLLE